MPATISAKLIKVPVGNSKRMTALVPAVALCVALMLPISVACQRQRPSPDAGIDQLRALVSAAGGSPSASDLLKFESRYPQSRAAALARFLRGYLAYIAKNNDAALEALDAKSIDSATSIGDYVLFFRAESEAASGANREALGDYKALISGNGDSLKAREAVLHAAQSLLSLGDARAAVKEASQLTASNDADAIYVTAQAYEAAGQTSDAIKLYRQIYYELPGTAASAQAQTRLVALGQATEISAESFERDLARCERLFAARQYFESASAYESLLAASPDKRTDEIDLHYGLSLLNNRQPAQAVAVLSGVSERDPSRYAEAQASLAEALRRSNRSAQNTIVVDRLISKRPKSRWTEEAILDLASSLNRDGREAESAVRYRQLLSMFPKGAYAAEASYYLGWQAYQEKRYAEAARILEQHLATYRYPDTKFIGEAGFWAAKSEERLGNRRRALALYDFVTERYRYGYHGYVSALRAGRLRASDPSLRPEQVKPGSDLEQIHANVSYVAPIDEAADGAESKRFAKADDLEVVGLYELAVKELNSALEKAPNSPKINLRLAQLYARRGDNFQATLVLRRGYPDIYSYREQDLPREAWQIFFPLSNWGEIKQEAKHYGIDPYSAAGLIRQESVFNPNAVSRAGARGLMQIMPATGQLIAKRQGNGSISAADLFNPDLNIKLGMSYFAQMLGRFGRLEYAAAAYNAGPNRAERWVAQRGSLDIEDWIESIPFSETRTYVQGVVRYTANYRRFYKD